MAKTLEDVLNEYYNLRYSTIRRRSSQVFYNPSKPHKSFLIIAGGTGIAITSLLGTLPFVLFYFKYYS